MRSKKTYREYQESESIKFPAAAWLLDQAGVYAVVLLVALIAIGAFMKMGWDSYTAAIKPPEVITPYADVTPVSFIGKTWAEKLISVNPANLPDWTVDKSAKPRPVIDPKNCSASAAASISLLSTNVATGSGTDVRIQVYGAGQAAKQFTDYTTAFTPCFGKLNVQNSGKTTFVTFSRGFILTSGDAIIGVFVPNDQIRDTILDFYLKNVESSLIESGCLALNATPADANRNLFFSKDQYTGLEGSENLESVVDTTNLPTPTSLTLKEIEDRTAVVPEAPLPANFPELPKTVVQKPQIPAALKNEDAFKASAKFRVVDEKGPGCGWDWTAQVSPELDLKKLATDKNNSIQKTQGALDGSATNYVSGKINWALQLASLAPTVDTWNSFVSQTNTVHKKWQWLEAERQKIESPWRQYVIDHDEWLTFDQRKADALKKFDEEFKQCQKDEKDLADWNRDWKDIADQQAKDKAKADAEAKDTEKNKPTASATPTPTPSATTTAPAVTVPSKPAGCSTPPVEPEIASQMKPEEPKAPVIPKDVTIPASWPTPKTN
jgi:hypothetical protein